MKKDIDKISRAKSSLILDSPFFANLVFHLEIKRDDSAPTMYTDGKVIGYNQKFIDDLSLNQLKGVLCHEALHIAFFHHLRRGNRNPIIWNMAGDYAINPIVKGQFELPEGGLLKPEFKDKGAEEIYRIIYEEVKQGQQGAGKGNGNGQPDFKNFGEVRDFKGANGKKPSKAEIKAEEVKRKIELTQAYNLAKNQGKVPGGMEKIIQELLEPKLNWKEILNQFLVEKVRNDYSWKMPNRRFISQGLYLPILESETIGKVVLIFDTSGSIGQREMNLLASEIQGILSAFDIEIEILYVDSAFQGSQTITKDDFPLALKPKGGGGTCFVPGFEYIEKNGIEPMAVVYLTDGYCSTFPEASDSPVLWVLTEKNRNFEPPFGEVLFLN
jgi:predicted metal-dependent peptidase